METATQAKSAKPIAVEAASAALAQLGADATALAISREAAAEVMLLTQDADLAVATALHGMRQAGFAAEPEALAPHFSAATLRLAIALGQLPLPRLPAGWSSGQTLQRAQAEALRKMLLAMAADPRLLVAYLSEQLVQLRHARGLPPHEQRRLALETRELYAPLANRLGVWSLKWELEDLAFRYLDPDDYHRIARALAERRIDRERYIEAVCALLSRELAHAGVKTVAVYGRAKHLYSIWRKMQRKGIAFEQLFDVRAVRIVVETLAECYAALGVVHGRWHYLPGEFDDYIATPKDNEYRSIHTAVIGPEGKSLEIQIRSRDMHDLAELGIAAHWRYKEGGPRDPGYERKIAWVRRVLDPAQSAEIEDDLIERAKSELFGGRIYAMTPQGDVIDLPRGATPLDFAYHVHTDLGHRCRGAKVNGRIVPLNHALANGDVVEIITGKLSAPSRDWLTSEEGFLAAPRSRAKVRAWFRRVDESSAAALDPALGRLRPGATPPRSPPRRRHRSAGNHSPVAVEGVGDLPVTMARCCGPVPPDAIWGYVTLGRGVTIHRAQCPSLLRMRAHNAERVLRVEWNLSDASRLPVRIRVRALDRRGLLRDVSDVMALEQLSIDGVNSNTDPRDRIATIVMRTAVRDGDQIARVLQRLGALPNVLSAQRLA